MRADLSAVLPFTYLAKQGVEIRFLFDERKDLWRKIREGFAKQPFFDRQGVDFMFSAVCLYRCINVMEF